MNRPYHPTDPAEASRAAASLAALPTLQDTRNRLVSTIERIGRQISAVAPTVTWRWHREESRTGCTPPYEQSEGQVILLANYLSDAPIPEQDWQRAYDIAAGAADELGATTRTVFKDAPNNHDVQFSNDTGIALRIASQRSAVLTGGTGCRLATERR
ncbi:LppA family lipoprotein [Mycolicibacterium palauense]|uniref:LppA family lipoprotein n=1 Tax=Mycolicibacterium palauense TaxID=2034511 RepID=UPI00159BB407|nr:LppA family lipoprotein [Mycolicibacterium palauense]